MTCLRNDSAILLDRSAVVRDSPGWGPARPHRVVMLIVTLWVLNAFDLIMTMLAHEQVVLEELNPVVDFLLLGGATSLVLFKVSPVTIGSRFLYHYRRDEQALVSVSFLVLVYGWLAVHWHFCYQWDEIALSIDSTARFL